MSEPTVGPWGRNLDAREDSEQRSLDQLARQRAAAVSAGVVSPDTLAYRAKVQQRAADRIARHEKQREADAAAQLVALDTPEGRALFVRTMRRNRT